MSQVLGRAFDLSRRTCARASSVRCACASSMEANRSTPRGMVGRARTQARCQTAAMASSSEPVLGLGGRGIIVASRKRSTGIVVTDVERIA